MGKLVDVTPAQAASLLAEAQKYEGKPYYTGGGSRSNPDKGFDCSGLVWWAITHAGFTYDYSSTSDIPHNHMLRYMKVPPESLMPGDLILFNGHVGFYDGNPPKAGKTLYSATSHGVRNEDPKFWGTVLGYYRLQVGS